jgi:23S rRNA pseudouridine2605 synthase
MPPRHSFWVILIGKTPTSFRGKDRDDLVPTLRQLQRTQSDVSLRWFERGKVWESPEAAIGAAKLAATAAREKRTKEWRPGGEHRDPRARFELTRDQKRAKFKRDQGDRSPSDERPPRNERGHDRDRPQSPFGPRPPRAPRPDRPWSDRSTPASLPERARPHHPRPDRPRPDRPWSDRAGFDRPKPGGSPFADQGPRPPHDRGKTPDRRWNPPRENPFKDRARSDRPAPRPDRPDRPGRSNQHDRSERRPDVRPSGRPGRPPSGRPVRPGRPGSGRGGFKPPKRRS